MEFIRQVSQQYKPIHFDVGNKFCFCILFVHYLKLSAEFVFRVFQSFYFYIFLVKNVYFMHIFLLEPEMGV